MSNTMHQLSYSNDLFFKYTLPRKDEGSVYARNTVIERVTGIRVKEGAVLNPNLDPGIIGKKRTIPDVHVRDEQNRHLNIEMQTTCRGIVEMMCPEFYGARALNDQLKNGEFYDQLKPVYQIIFIDEYIWNNKNLANRYQMCNEQREDESGYPLILRTSVHMSATNDTVKGKEMQGLDDFEQLAYLFEDDEKNDILKLKGRLVRVFMNKYKEMRKDDGLRSTVMAVQMGEVRYRNGLRDSFGEGEATGKTGGKMEGKLEGKGQPLHRLIEIEYHGDCVMWLQALTRGRMYIVPTLFLECDISEPLKKQSHSADMK